MGGIEANTVYVAEALSARHDVTVLVNRHDESAGEETIRNVRVIRKSINLHMMSQPICFRLFEGIDLREFDLIQFHAPNPFANAALLLQLFLSRSKAQIIVTHHMDIYGRKAVRALILPLYHMLVRRSAGVIVTSKKNAKISKDLPSGGEIYAVPLGIDPARYIIDDQLREQARGWKKRLVGDGAVVGFLGRHARYKGLNVLIDALSQMPNVSALIAGEGPYKEIAVERARSLGLSDRIRFLGKIDHLTKLMFFSAINVFVFPSTEVTEAFGMSQLEAMACGTPVVASNLPTGVTDVSIDNQTALLAIPGNVESLISALKRLLDQPILAQRLGQQGRKHVLGSMAENVVAEKTCAIIEQALVRRTKARGNSPFRQLPRS